MLLGDVCEESDWKKLKFKKAKNLSDLADILPRPNPENEVSGLQADFHSGDKCLCRVFRLFIEYNYANYHSYNFERG